PRLAGAQPDGLGSPGHRREPLLHCQLRARRGVVLVGSPGCGRRLAGLGRRRDAGDRGRRRLRDEGRAAGALAGTDPADPADTAWSVTIGEHRRIESLNGEWAAPTPRGAYPLRSTEAVFADLQHGKARYSGPQPMTALAELPAVGGVTAGGAVTVHVTGVSL